jgi:segregation and condensation protein B
MNENLHSLSPDGSTTDDSVTVGSVADGSASDGSAGEPRETGDEAAPAPDLEDCVRLVEALVFASGTPVSLRALTQVLPESVDPEAVIAALRACYAGRGVELIEVAGGVQFRTAPDLAPRLRKVVEVPRRLSRVTMETLAIIAYHQPVTRPEIEEIRGAGLSQQTLDSLLEAGLVAPKGRKEAPGRPTMWATTPAFLAQFGLKDLGDLPRRADLLIEPPSASPDPDEPTGEPTGEPMGERAAEPEPPQRGPDGGD